MRPEGEDREKGTEGIFETIMTDFLPKLMADSESLENTKSNKCQKDYTWAYHLQITEKVKIKKKSQKKLDHASKKKVE